jgi:membrane protein implicated in regulation of membrane protease activity
MTVFWLVVGVLLLGLEVLTQALFALFAAAGLFGAAIAAALGAPVWAQVLVFAGVAVAGMVLGRPPLVRALHLHPGPITLPGVHGLVGQRAVTVDVVGDEHHPGHALLAGERWLAFTDAGPLGPDVPVTVAAVHGTTLLVRPVQSGPAA